MPPNHDYALYFRARGRVALLFFFLYSTHASTYKQPIILNKPDNPARLAQGQVTGNQYAR